ncbi:Probable 2-oxoglutarate-dependent dioxygenase AOP1 (Fragment) [Linum perenne]
MKHLKAPRLSISEKSPRPRLHEDTHNLFSLETRDDKFCIPFYVKAWSNGRLHAVRHRVVILGEKERYSWGMFLMPKEEATIEVPKEFVDKEHPLLYPPFNYAEYLSYFVNKLGDDALEIYAGVSPIGIA